MIDKAGEFDALADSVPLVKQHARQLNDLSPLLFRGVHGQPLGDFLQKLDELEQIARTAAGELRNG